MKNRLIIAALFAFITLNSFQCGKNVSDPCTQYNKDTVLLNHSFANVKATFKVGDTIKIEALISDNLPALSGNINLSAPLNQLYLKIQPYSIIKNSTLPELQYANIEFNPYVGEGQLVNSSNGGYNYLYKRTSNANSLKIGFIAGRPGLYLFDLSNDRYSYQIGGGLALYASGDNCTTYWGISNFNKSSQNLQYWDSLGVAAVSVSPNYGFGTVSKNNRNYFLFKVIP